MTMIIAVPDRRQGSFNWPLRCLAPGPFTVPILWSIGFMVTFVIGAGPAADGAVRPPTPLPTACS